MLSKQNKDFEFFDSNSVQEGTNVGCTCKFKSVFITSLLFNYLWELLDMQYVH